MKRIVNLFFVTVFFIALTSMANSQAIGGASLSFGIVGINEVLPANATLISKGEVVSVSQEDHTVSVRDSSSGIVNVYSITNQQVLGSVNQGEMIKVFSQP